MQRGRNFWTSAVGVCHHVDSDVIGEGFFRLTTRWAMPWMTPISSAGGGCRWDDVLYNFSLQTWLRYRFACDYILTSHTKCLSSNLMLSEIDILRNHSCLIEEPIRNAIGLSIIWRGQVCWHRIGWRVFGGRDSGEGVLFKLAEVSKTDSNLFSVPF